MLKSMQASQDGSFSAKVRKAIHDRATGSCERCGHGGRWWEYHHRLPRGMGGVSNDWTGLPSNGLLLCSGCHRWIEQNRAEAMQHGWLVEIGADPAGVPVLLHDGRLVLLDVDGSYRLAVPKLDVALTAGYVATSW